MPGLMEIPGLAGILQARQLNEQSSQRDQAGQLAQLQQVGALQGILAKVQAAKQAESYRNELQGLGANPSQEALAGVAAKFGSPDKVMDVQQRSLDRQTTLRVEAAKMAQAHQYKMDEIKQRSTDAATTAKELLAEKQAFEQRMKEFVVANRAPTPEQPPVAVQKLDGTGNEFVDRKAALGRAPAVKETADRVIPANIAKAYTENSTALRKIDSALSEVDKYPDAFGLQNLRGDAISQRVDPKGVTARAIVADIGSLKIHDRSGAAVTAAETPRLLPFIPNVNDNAATIKKKLALFRKEYAAIQSDIDSMYSKDQGYRALPSAQTRSTDTKVSPVDALLEKYK